MKEVTLGPKRPIYIIVFENLRNLGVCLTLAIAGVAIMKYESISIFGPALAAPLGFFVLLVTILLLAWNAIQGISELCNTMKVPSVRFFLIALPLGGIYTVLCISVWGAVIQGQILKC